MPLLVGSNSADTAGNRIKATTKDELFARFGKWSAQAKAAYDPDGTTELATLVSRANDDFGQAEPARFAANAFAANGSPAYLYRFSYVASAMREQMRAGAPHGGEIWLCVRHARRRARARRHRPRIWRSRGWRRATGSTSPGPATRTVRACRPGRGTIPKKDVIFEFRPDGSAGAGPDSRKARLDVTQLNTEAGKRSDP